jgi:hypothetical protein
LNQKESVVLELLSLYAKILYEFSKKDCYISRLKNESEEKFLKRKIEAEFEFIDKFAEIINDVFLQFGIKYHLTRDGFVPRQDKKIIEEIYKPVLDYLASEKWRKVNEILSDAFSDYGKNTPQGYSNCITNTVSAIQAFLQILKNGKTGSGNISQLIMEAQKDNLIPNDYFTRKIFDNMESIFAKERQETGVAHPKKEYATEKNARLILNLTMIFLQHCI